jgi:hypothetical protein
MVGRAKVEPAAETAGIERFNHEFRLAEPEAVERHVGGRLVEEAAIRPGAGQGVHD